MAEKRRTSNLALSGDGGLFKTDAYLYDDFGSEILAYLQYAIDERLPNKIVPMALISHLKKNCQWKITKARVEAKLKYFWQRTKPAGAKDSDFDLIYQRSYKALPQLPKEFVIQVRKRADDLSIFLNKTDRRWRLRSASCTVSPIRKHATASLSKMSRSGPRASRAHRSRSQTEAVAATNGGFLLSPRHGNSVDYAGMTSTRAVVKREQPTVDIRGSPHSISNDPQAASKEPLCRHNRRPCNRVSPVRSDSTDDSLSERSTTSSVLGTRCEEPSAADDMGRDPWGQLEDTRLQKNSEIRYWRDRCARVEAKCTELQDRNCHLQIAAFPGNGANANAETKLRADVDTLRRRLDAYHATRPFLKTAPQCFPPVDLWKNAQDMKLIYRKLSDLLPRWNTTISLCLGRLESQADLSTLLQRCFELDICATSFPEETERLFPGAQLRNIITSLVSAALCEWVFESDLKMVFQENSPVYSSLSRLLQAHDPIFAQGLEFAAHHGVLQDPSMSELLIPNLAQSLVRRMMRALLPLLESQKSSAANSQNMARDWLGEERRLLEIFKLAIQIKSRLLISTDLFRCIWPLPEADLNMETMRPEPVSEASNKVQSRRVKFTILPGLERCTANIRRFTYNRFVKDGQGMDGTIWEPFSEAIVVMD